ncbi:MAG TPA: MATE family efflux transporter, partial [Clostridia bacterium]|nr:MATE family efflux transporter [Clostridia bacterium]
LPIWYDMLQFTEARYCLRGARYMSKSKQMTDGSIPKLLLKFSLPAIIGMLVHALYNVIDSIFVGRGVGELALAGITVSFPVVIILMAFVMLIGMGATTLISIRLGEKKASEAEQIVGNALGLFIVIGLGLTTIGLIYIEPLLIFFGASVDVLPFALDYMKIILFGSVLMALGVGMNNFIRAEGNPKIAMYTMLIGAITNIILDYIFIFIFFWGIKGAAIATVLSYAVSSTWVLYYFLSGNSLVKIRLKNLAPKWIIIKTTMKIGFPAFAMQITASVQNLILNRSLVHYGGDLALATVGILMSISTLLIMPVIGISQGAQPIIGFNYGAKKLGRVKMTVMLAVITASAIVTFFFIISRIWPTQLIGLFNLNPELIRLGTHAVLIYFVFLPLVGIQIIGAGYFQAVGKPVQATILSLSRQVIIFIPLLLILPLYLGLDGIWWAVPFSDLGACLLTGTWLWFEMRHLTEAEDSYKKEQEVMGH